MTSTDSLHVLDVFTPRFPPLPGAHASGGNPTAVTLDADALSVEEMRAITAKFGHESAFVVVPPEGFDFAFRFFVPKHEMEMCGHATIGTLWLLHQLGRWPRGREQVSVWTKSGRVMGRLAAGGAASQHIEISQPKGRVSPLPNPAEQEARIASVLGVSTNDFTHPVCNAITSRVKTLVPLKNADAVHALKPDFARVETLCDDLGSTGLYPYAPVDLEHRIFEARQFPKSSGYPEDPATGIAAAALAFGLLEQGRIAPDARPIRVMQGRAMGRPSEIRIAFHVEGDAVPGCWLTGDVRWESRPE